MKIVKYSETTGDPVEWNHELGNGLEIHISDNQKEGGERFRVVLRVPFTFNSGGDTVGEYSYAQELPKAVIIANQKIVSLHESPTIKDGGKT